MLHSIFHIVVNFSNLKKIDFQQQQQKKVFQLPSFFSSTASSSGCGVGDRFFSVGGSDGVSFLFSIVDVMRFQMLSKESLPVKKKKKHRVYDRNVHAQNVDITVSVLSLPK